MSRPAFRTTDLPAPSPAGTTAVFDRVLCGYDGRERSVAAVRQVALLRTSGARVLCVTVSDNRVWPRADEAATILDRLERSLGHPDWLEVRSVEGMLDRTLERLAVGVDATLVAVGAPRGGRIRSAIRWDAAGHLLHHVPSSVLLARPSAGEWPARVVVGVDGSEHAARALEVARCVAERRGVPLLPVAAGEAAADPSDEVARLPGVALDGRPPVDALVATAAADDLLVVGSRGMTGLASLGSVSERVAHAAACSVLVVRPGGTERPPVADGGPDAVAAARVGELMSGELTRVAADRPLVEVARLVLERGLECVGVEEPSSGRYLGLLTTKELLGVDGPRVWGTALRWPRFLGEPVWSEAELTRMFSVAGDTPVGELVRPPRLVLGEDDPALYAAELLGRHQVSQLPVLRGDRLVGIVSAADLLRLATGETEPARHPP